MKTLLVILVSFLLTACGQLIPQPKAPVIEPQLQSLYEQFMRDCARWGAKCKTDNLTIELVSELSDDSIGRCTMNISKNGFTRNVYILNSLSYTEMELTFYHENLHCMLGANHFDGAPDILNTDTRFATEVEANFQKYIQIAFTRFSHK